MKNREDIRYIGNITGSSITGSTIRGNDMYIKDSLYIYSTSVAENGNAGGDFQALKIVPSAWNSGNTSYDLVIGDSRLESVALEVNLQTRTINGGTPVTSNNFTTQLFSDWTSSKNLRTYGLYNLASVDYVQEKFTRIDEFNSLKQRVAELDGK